jgi:RNA polymerase sigma-32 factor
MASANTSDISRRDRQYMSATMKLPLLEREREAALSRDWHERRDDAALHELVSAHARLVVRIAAGFRRSGLPLPDLIQEGNIGLIEAADRFDPERGVRFSTYASWWIRAAIQGFILRNSSIVRAATTPKQRYLFFSIRRLQRRAGGYDGRLSDGERAMLAARVGVDPAEVERMESHVARPDQSLNVAVGEDESAERQDMVVDPAPTPHEIAEQESLKRARGRWIREALARLSPRERRIVRLRFFGDHKVHLHDIGVVLGISKERVRQIEARALQKLKAALTDLAGGAEELAGS